MKIFNSVIPNNSFLFSEQNKYDYIDSFEATFHRSSSIRIEDLAKAFFKSAPIWVEVLFNLRNRLVKYLGLKTSDEIENREQYLQKHPMNVGDRIGLFKIYNKSSNELIMGEDDQHLDFRVSLYCHNLNENSNDAKLIISTAVKYNNNTGRIYFFIVKPFHKIIVLRMMKSSIQQITMTTKD